MITISWDKGSAHLAEINIGPRNQLHRDWRGVAQLGRGMWGLGLLLRREMQAGEWCGH